MRVRDRLHLAGGGAPPDSYDPDADAWRDGPWVREGIDHVQAVAVGGLIYYIGGLRMIDRWPNGEQGSVDVYDPAAQTVDTTRTTMPAGRERGAGGVAVHEGRIYYVGGLHEGTAVAWVDRYDPVANTWRQLPDMPTARDHVQAVVLGSRLHVIGGRRGPMNSTTGDHDALDLDTGAWRTGLAPLPTPRGGYGATILGEEIVVIGGETEGHVFDEVEAYRPVTGTWRALAPMPRPRHGFQAATCSGAIYVAAGGSVAGWGPTNEHDRLTLGAAPSECVNATPVCESTSLSAPTGAAVAGRLTCGDDDGDALSFEVVSAPAHGRLSGPDAAGRFTYEGDAGFAGTDAFHFRATDGDRSPVATVSVAVGTAAGQPPGGGPGGGVQAGRLPARLRRALSALRVGRAGRATVSLRCPSQRRACAGRLDLVTVERLRGTRVRLARRGFAVAAGAVAKVRLRVSARGRRLLRRGPLRATLTVAADGVRAADWQRVRLTTRLARQPSTRP